MTTRTIDIRHAIPADADGIAAVHVSAWTGAYAGIIPHKALNGMLTRRGRDWWMNAIRRATSILVVDLDGEVVGYATYGRNRVRELPEAGEIYELYIAPQYQGVGIGTRLFSAVREALADHGMKGLVVWALADNAGAMQFYEGLGGRDSAEGVEIFDARALKKIAYTWG